MTKMFAEQKANFDNKIDEVIEQLSELRESLAYLESDVDDLKHHRATENLSLKNSEYMAAI